MPRQSKGPRLWLRQARRDRRGAVTHPAVWIIRDGDHQESTARGAGDREAAERALGAYIARKYQPTRDGSRAASHVAVADVLNIWLTEVAAEKARPGEAAQRAETLLRWWGDKLLSDVTEKSCKAYVAHRTSQPRVQSRPDKTGRPARMVTAAGARRELEDLRAAINDHGCADKVSVWLPERSPPRERWLTRSEAARLLWELWRARDPPTGRPTRRHVARFMIVGLYTGTRAGAVCGAGVIRMPGRGFIDVETGVFYRRAARTKETKKRQPPARLSPRLLAHVRRWVRLGISHRFVVEWNGKPVQSVRKAWESARRDAQLDAEVLRHTLRHTAATWAMQNGAPIWETAGYLGMSPDTLTRNYGHHHPDHQAGAAAAISASPQKRHRMKGAEPEHSVADRPQRLLSQRG